MPGTEVSALAYNGTHVIAGHENGTVRAWNAHTGKCVNVLADDTGFRVRRVRLARKNIAVSIAFDHKVTAWNIDTGVRLYVLSRQWSELCHLCARTAGRADRPVISGDHLLTVDNSCIKDKETIGVRSVYTGRLLRSIHVSESAVHLSLVPGQPDLVVSNCFDGTVHMWNIVTGARRACVGSCVRCARASIVGQCR
jgi:hypothetical protein